MISAGRLYYIDGHTGSVPSLGSNIAEYRSSLGIADMLKKDICHILDTVESKGESRLKITLVLDAIDLLLSTEPALTASGVCADMLSFQERTHHLVVSVSADAPLLHQSRSPLEEKHQSFVTTIAHQSNRLIQLRSLDTGAARDISGVVRISHGGQYQSDDNESNLDEHEYLYFVSNGGSVIRIWSRGE